VCAHETDTAARGEWVRRMCNERANVTQIYFAIRNPNIFVFTITTYFASASSDRLRHALRDRVRVVGAREVHLQEEGLLFRPPPQQPQSLPPHETVFLGFVGKTSGERRARINAVATAAAGVALFVSSVNHLKAGAWPLTEMRKTPTGRKPAGPMPRISTANELSAAIVSSSNSRCLAIMSVQNATAAAAVVVLVRAHVMWSVSEVALPAPATASCFGTHRSFCF